MERSDFELRGGEVTYWDLSAIDSRVPLSAQGNALKEDLAQVMFSARVLVDVGWYGGPFPSGRFVVCVICDEDWAGPVWSRSCGAVSELIRCVNDGAARAADLAREQEQGP